MTSPSYGRSAPRDDRGPELRWLVLARWIAVSLLTLGAAVAVLQGFLKSAWPILGVCAAIAAYHVAFSRLVRTRVRPQGMILGSLLLDVVALTVFLHYSGDIENPLLETYALPVVAASVLLDRTAAYVVAAAAILLFSLLMGATAVDAFPFHVSHHHLALLRGIEVHEHTDPDLLEGPRYIVTHLLSLSAILFGSAYGFGALSQRIRERDDQLRAENERMTLLLDTLPVGVVLLGQDRSILISNPAARTLIPEVDGGSLSGIDQRLGLLRRFEGLSGAVEEFETTVDGRVLGHALAGSPGRGPTVWVFRDLTEQRRLMAEVIHHSKMADLGLLAAGIAHEIGNPLSSMSAILQILEMKKTVPEATEKLRALASHVDRIDQIVREFTGFARPSAGRSERTTLEGITAKVLEIFRLHERSKGLELDVAFEPSPVDIEVVEDQMVQVVLNLLLNAADASTKGGRIRLATSATDGEVRLSVTDHGTGIRDEDRKHLFTPFFTTKEPGKGVGLGLFVSESILRTHGGGIEVESALGRGSTFTVRLPRAGARPG